MSDEFFVIIKITLTLRTSIVLTLALSVQENNNKLEYRVW